MLKLLILLSCISEPICKDAYLNKVLEGECLSKYYIVIKIKVGEKYGDAVVLNNNLYELLKKRDRSLATISKYRDFAKSKIINNEPFILSKKQLNKIQSSFILTDSAVLNWVQKGRREFLQRFFYVSEELNYARLKPDVPEKSIPTIISVLFNWNYLMNNVEGSLEIEKLDFCQALR